MPNLIYLKAIEIYLALLFIQGNIMFMEKEESAGYQHFLKELTEHFKIKETSTEIEPVGERIKKIRKSKGVSIKELSAKTGFPEELLSQIESQSITPQIGTIIKLAKSLKTVFGTLTAEEGRNTYSVVRQEDRKVVSRHASQKGHNYEYISLASDVKERHMESFIVKLGPETPDQELSIHEGEEFIFVINGEMKAILGDEVKILSTGDSIYYFSNIPHLVVSNKNDPAYILAVIYTGSS